MCRVVRRALWARLPRSLKERQFFKLLRPSYQRPWVSQGSRKKRTTPGMKGYYRALEKVKGRYGSHEKGDTFKCFPEVAQWGLDKGYIEEITMAYEGQYVIEEVLDAPTQRTNFLAQLNADKR